VTAPLDPVLSGSVGHDVFLVRHAPTSWTGRRWCGRADPPLTRAGRRIATEVGRILASHITSATLILTSPSQRARETAEAIAASWGSPTDVDEDLVEVDVGLAEGVTWAVLEKRYPEVAERLSAGAPVDWPDGETAIALRARAARVAHRITVRSSAFPLVVVSHGGFLHQLASGLGSADIAPLAPGGIVRISGAALR
jgi:ribonuclease HI/probable phosphoglycerate mutase